MIPISYTQFRSWLCFRWQCDSVAAIVSDITAATSVIFTSCSSGVMLRYTCAALFAASPPMVSPFLGPFSTKQTCQALSGDFFGAPVRRAFFLRAVRSDAAFRAKPPALSTLFARGFGFGFAFFFGAAFFAAALFLGAAFLVVADFGVVRLVVVLPVCAFGRPTGRVVVA